MKNPAASGGVSFNGKSYIGGCVPKPSLAIHHFCKQHGIVAFSAYKIKN
jgi:hypothetical protein